MTRTLTLKNCFQGNTTIVENDFIDNYIAKANGEYVKVYLMLLRHLQTGSTLSISILADYLECTERDILRAFTYWEKEKLLHIEYDESGNVCGLAIGKEGAANATAGRQPVSPIETPAAAESKTSSKAEIIAFSEKPASPVKKAQVSPEDMRQLFFVAEQYLGKTLSSSDIKKIQYFADTLGFSTDLIEYLIEYCVEKGHRSFRYIESVAMAWADEGIQTVTEAKENSANYGKHSFAILNAFGIKGRGPAPAETVYIRKWTDEYGFELDLILEACNRTIQNTHKPDFKYTDSILASWLSKDVHHLADVTALDLAHLQKKAAEKKSSGKQATKTGFTNFEGRSYDMSSLEEQLLNS